MSVGLACLPAARGQDADEVKRLRATVAALEAKLKQVEKEVESLKKEVEALKMKPAAGKKSLSEQLPAGTVLERDFRTTGADKAGGKAVVTVGERDGNKLTGSWTVTLNGKESEPAEFEGEISGGRITLRSVGSVNKATMTGEAAGGGLELNFTSNNNVRAKVVLKLPK